MAHVLLVDDHPDLVEVLMQLLRTRGHTVECCASAEDALLRIDQSRPQIVIADQRLPGISGLEMIRLVKSRAECADLPVILCSADDSLACQALEAGALEFWLKGSEQLFEHVDRLAQRLCTDRLPTAG